MRQAQQDALDGFSDSDFAGCLRTAKSTSGGVLIVGRLYIKSKSATHKTVALSSGEAELTALVKCSCETIGVLQLAQDWEMHFEGNIIVDSSAALGVVARKGARKLRHVRVGQFWVQEASELGDLRYRKVKRTDNPAAVLTNALIGIDICQYMSSVGLEARAGRADKSLEIDIG